MLSVILGPGRPSFSTLLAASTTFLGNILQSFIPDDEELFTVGESSHIKSPTSASIGAMPSDDKGKVT